MKLIATLICLAALPAFAQGSLDKGGTSESNQAVNAAADPGTSPAEKPAKPVKKTHISKPAKSKLPTSSGSTTSGGE